MIRPQISNTRKAAFAIIASGALALVSLQMGGCGSSSSSSTEDSSTSGSVASGIGGAVNGSTSSGTMARASNSSLMDRLFILADPATSAMASTACPVFSSAALGTTLTYTDCSFGNSAAVWNGSVAFSGSAGSVTREVTNGTTRTAASGSVVTINTTGSSLNPFNSDAAPSGGTTATISSGTVTGLAINGVNFAAKSAAGTTLFNHVLTTSAGNGGTALTLSNGVLTGTVITYHQLARVKATSSVSVGMSSGCCTPTSGTITTTFNTNATGATAKYNGVTESLTFTGCGTATYSGPEGYSGAVTLAHCL